jgi:hypothetical protein
MQRHLSFTVKGNTYPVNFPTVAQFIDIESTKAKLAGDAYQDMMRVGTFMSVKALDLIDMTANLTVLCPELLKDAKASSILAMDLLDAKELLAAYVDQFVPWLVAWQKVLNTIEKSDDVVDESIEEDFSETED